MADRSYLNRLRTSGGPSHHLLVLLDQHRVMTTGQLARATGTPVRTVRYRIERAHQAGLVECARPGREQGSAPRHWWLRPAGARLVTGTAVAEGRPSGMFVAHAAAITEVWLALVENGPAVGMEMVSWLTDRAGWQEWERTDRWSSHPHRLTPDAVATVRLDDSSEVIAFVEVDLASMTQTVLKQKVGRYLAYAADLAWQDHWPYCPAMLLLTTTATRAASFVRAAGQTIAQQRKKPDPNDPAAQLVVAACGHVRDPARAVTEPCWALPDVATADLTWPELLTERLDAQAASAAWLYQRDVVQRRTDELWELHQVARHSTLADTLGSHTAAETLRVLIGDDTAAFLDGLPDLARQIVEWAVRRRRIHMVIARDLAQQSFVPELERRHRDLWLQQAGRVLATDIHILANNPPLYRLVRTLASGHLVAVVELATLDRAPAQARQELQQKLFGDYTTQRAASVERELQRLRDRRERHRTSAEWLAADYDDKHLTVCDTCCLIYPVAPDAASVPSRCQHCEGDLLDWPDRGQAEALEGRLNALGARAAQLADERTSSTADDNTSQS